MEWFLKVVRDNYANFNGRARRKEYWMFLLFQIIISIVAALLDNALGLTFSELIPYGYLYFGIALALFIPGLAVAVRRMHDVGKSGWILLIALIPLAGLYILYLAIKKGDQGDNQYGPDPKGSNELEELGAN